jgi:hypothetical protein
VLAPEVVAHEPDLERRRIVPEVLRLVRDVRDLNDRVLRHRVSFRGFDQRGSVVSSPEMKELLE